MNHINSRMSRAGGSELERIIEPLANYICAAKQPKQALLSVMAILRHEVDATNRAALSYFRSYSEN
jgi:hypothetical protein